MAARIKTYKVAGRRYVDPDSILLICLVDGERLGRLLKAVLDAFVCLISSSSFGFIGLCP